jgi:hypothetical protein
MVGHDVAFFDPAFLLFGQTPKKGAKLSAPDAKERLAPMLGDEDNVVFALPLGVAQVLVFFHGFLVVVRFARLTTPPHGRTAR